MDRALKDKQVSLLLIIVCFAAYIILNFTRNAYTAALAGIIKDGIFSKTNAGVINSSFWITYSLAQIWGSFFIDRVSPFKILALALIGTFFSNIAMAISSSFAIIFVARALSGVFQFGVWPALLKIMTEYISDHYRRKFMYIMPLGIPAGTILSLLIASVVLDVGKWQDLFTISYLLLVAISVLFFIAVYYAGKKSVPVTAEHKEKIAPSSTKSTKKEPTPWRLILISGAIPIGVVSFFKSLIMAGVSSWMPTMIMESYNSSPGFSSILTAVAACSNFASVFWVILLYPKVFRSQPLAVGMFLLLLLPALIPLVFIGKIPLWLAVTFIIFINMFANSISQFFTVEIPSVYGVYNKAGMMAGFFNVFACVGTMAAGTVFGYTAENYGWSSTILLWAILALLAAVISFSVIPIWKMFLKNR